MEYQDRLTITTPEGVELDLELAGLGSRFTAQAIDLLIKVLSIGLLALALRSLGLTGYAILIPAAALIQYAYDVVFETFANGRTPGKRAVRLRVLRAEGEPVDFMSSAIRNVLRLVDGVLVYLPGMVSILATKRNQRLGDLAAGTIVVHEDPVAAPGAAAPPPAGPPGGGPPGAWGQPAPPPAPQPATGAVWDVSAVGAEEAAAVRSFLDRRWALEPTARGRLALEFADALWPKVGGAPGGLPPEAFLEQLAQQKSGRA